MEKGIKAFYDNTGAIFQIKSSAAISLMGKLIFMTEENRSDVVISSKTKTVLSEELGVATITISRSLEELKRTGVMANKKNSKGEIIKDRYILNPLMFWHGDLEERTKAVQKYKDYFSVPIPRGGISPQAERDRGL